MSDDDVLDAFDGETLDLIVPGALDEIRLDRVLALLTGLSRSEASDIIAAGAVHAGRQGRREAVDARARGPTTWWRCFPAPRAPTSKPTPPSRWT